MCVEVFATYTCGHTVPVWIPCSTFAMASCKNYQRQYRTRPLRCSCTCPTPDPSNQESQYSAFFKQALPQAGLQTFFSQSGQFYGPSYGQSFVQSKSEPCGGQMNQSSSQASSPSSAASDTSNQSAEFQWDFSTFAGYNASQ